MKSNESPFSIKISDGKKTTTIPVEYHGEMPEEITLENGMKFRPITKLIALGDEELMAINPFTDNSRIITDKVAGLIRKIEIKTQNGIDSIDDVVELREIDNTAYMSFID